MNYDDKLILKCSSSISITTSRSLCMAKSPKLNKLLASLHGNVLPVKGTDDEALAAVVGAFSDPETRVSSLSFQNLVHIYDVAVKLEVKEIQRQCHELLSSTRHFSPGLFFSLFASCLGSSLMEHLYSYASDDFTTLSTSREFLSSSPQVAEAFLVNSWRAMVIKAVQPDEDLSSEDQVGARQLVHSVDRATLLVSGAVDCWARQPDKSSASSIRQETKSSVMKLISERSTQQNLPPLPPLPPNLPPTLPPAILDNAARCRHNKHVASSRGNIDPMLNRNQKKGSLLGLLSHPSLALMLQRGVKKKPRKVPKNALDADAEAICSVSGCKAVLGSSGGKRYNLKYRLCDEHLKAPQVEIEGKPHRFCQQCSKFHPCSEFDGTQRSCRQTLEMRKKKKIWQGERSFAFGS